MKSMKRLILSFSITLMAVSTLLIAPHAAALSLFDWLTGSPSNTPSTAQTTSLAGAATTDSCFVYSNHIYEVCTAYIANSSLAVLVPYYKYGRSPNSSLQSYAAYRLGQRYTGSANLTIKNRVASWPAGNYDVSWPDIRIVSVVSDLMTNTATLVTQESWTVTDQQDRVVYREANRRHVVSMQRVPSYVLHKWVVTDIR